MHPTIAGPKTKETNMINPLHMAARAAGACALALAFLAPVQAAPALQMSAATSAAGVDLTVRAQDVVDLYGYQFTLNFNPTLLTALGGVEGAFLPGGGSTFFSSGVIDNAAGAVSFVLGSLIGLDPGVDGSGDLVTFSFAVDQAGLANFSFSDVLFLDSNLDAIAITATDLVAQVGQVPEPGSFWLAGIGLFAVLGGRAIRAKNR